MKYFPKIIGEKVFLSPISLDDAETFTLWLNDPETTRYLSLSSIPISLQSERDALGHLAKEHNYSIIEKSSGELLGNCGIMDINEADRSAEVGIFIGAKDKRGRGYGSEALRLLCDYGFNVLNLHNLMLRVYAYNERAMASYRKVGFKEVGRKREARFYGGAYHDVVIMDFLAGEFGPSVLPPATCS
jgi:RimJ/RimL family protein N-acetyltransferase